VIHEAGGKVCLQILRIGRYSRDENPIALSPIKAPANRFVSIKASNDQIDQEKTQRRAKN
jgi:2,4-dienoyl-CoA reductase (NADPH2)